MKKYPLLMILMATIPLLGACSSDKSDPRALDRDETFLTVSATGQSESSPDMANFSAGISTIRSNAKQASTDNATKMAELVKAIENSGIDEKDIQTRNLSLNRITYGPNKNKFEAVNQISVRVRDIEKTSEAIAAATQLEANILSGPTLSLSNPEKAKLSGYGAAYKAARAKADAYAEAAGMKVSRVLNIRDAGLPRTPSFYGDAVYETVEEAPPPVSAPPIREGTNIDTVSVTIDFALESQ